MVGIVSLKASLEAWDRVDEILRQSLGTYAHLLEHLEHHLSRRASERFNMKGFDFSSQRATLSRSGKNAEFGTPVLETVSREVESELRTFGERLCEQACSSQDLIDVASTLNQAIAGIQEMGCKHQQVMRTTAGRLRTASESDNVTALRILVRYQSALSPACSAARWGGDEFIVLVNGSISTGMSVAQKMDQQLRARYKLGEGQAANVYAQASVGLSDWKPGECANTVVERADLALKAKKRIMVPIASELTR